MFTTTMKTTILLFLACNIHVVNWDVTSFLAATEHSTNLVYSRVVGV